VSAWLAVLARGRILELSVALALGTALAALAQAATATGLDIVGQFIGRNPFVEESGDVTGLTGLVDTRFLLNFEVGSTVIFYGDILAALLALGLVTTLGLAVVRRRNRVLSPCPHCASLIPRRSTHCAHCGSSVEPTGV
jgi:large-conductance mechanosensitive channel